MDISFETYVHTEDGVKVVLQGVPLLRCPACMTFELPIRTRAVIGSAIRTAKENGKGSIEIKPTGAATKRYAYGKADFLYSPLDYDFIPGLRRMDDDGFLTPVFFNPAVLNKYATDPSYKLDLFSDTYGSIAKGDEFDIAFGINRSRKVFMWLGDIDALPVAEQYHLRSENIESDHDVKSEFYDGQIGAVFSGPSLENRAIHARAAVNQRCREKYGWELYQLPTEIARVIEGLHRPVFWEERHVRTVAEALNRVMTESIDVTALKKAIEPHVNPGKLKSLKGLKLLELWLEHVLNVQDPKPLTLPFFVLYDFRVLTCHLTSDSTREQQFASICTRLALDAGNKNLEPVYLALLQQLEASLNAIRRLIV